jgi:uncharacterized protein YkwD
MSSRHGNGRRTASHRRPRAGQPVRRIALTAGALTVVAGVGTGVAVVQSGGDAPVAEARTTADRAASSASPMAEEAVPRTTSASPSKSKSPSSKRAKASATPTPRRTATQTPRTRAAEKPSATRSATDDRSVPDAREAPDAATGDAARIVELVNQERSKTGCSPVTANSKLNAAAQKYTDVMADSGVLSHTGPDGSQISDRVEREGYVWSAIGENIAQGQQSPEEVMNSWMNSSGHRANILNCSFREIGIGIHEGDGGPWWTQDFGTSR